MSTLAQRNYANLVRIPAYSLFLQEEPSSALICSVLEWRQIFFCARMFFCRWNYFYISYSHKLHLSTSHLILIISFVESTVTSVKASSGATVRIRRAADPKVTLPAKTYAANPVAPVSSARRSSSTSKRHPAGWRCRRPDSSPPIQSSKPRAAS